MKYIKSLYTAIVVLLLTACQSEQWEGLEGGFIVSLEEEVTVSTKSTPAELDKPDPELFKLKIVKESNGNTLYDGNFTGKTIPASAGLYTLTATCGDNPILALDAPYYKGEESGIEVTEGETTPVELKCSVANALTSVIYDEPEKFNDLYSSYALKIAVGNQSVTIGPSQSYKSAYYQAGTIPVFQFVGTLKDNGQEVSTTLDDERLKDAATFAAGKHCKLTLKVKPTDSGVILTVDKVEVETVSISETIPVEWLPKPKIDGFENGQTSLTYTETASAIPAQLKFTGSLAIQEVEFSFNFQDLQEKFQALNNRTFLLSQLSEEDRTLLNAASIILPSLDGTNTGLFDFTAMTSSLQTLTGGADAVNTINLRVKANNRWSSEEPAMYEIRTVKPEFNVSVNVNNCWSREFTIDEITATTGNVETLKNDLIYQYYNGTEWVECATREAVKGRTQQFNVSAENIILKTYRVRALYRGTIASTEAEATLETPVQLPNSGMEEWHYNGPFSHDVYSYYPYLESNGNYWSTNNDYTTRYRQGTFGYPYNCFPAVSYVPGRNGGKAAEIRNTASGAGNTTETWFTDASIDNRNRVAGILFTGDFECSTGVSATSYSYTKTNGKEFNTRPTAMKFWYKYIPYTNDTWQAHIELWDENKNIIVQQNFQSSIQKNNYEEVEIKLNYNDQQTYPTCKYIYIIFQSTINEGENMPFEWFKDTYVLWRDEQQYSYKEPHIGSILTIDDISLIYDK